MYNDRAKALWDTAVVEKKFGVRPDQLADYLALTGDASDNVPGVVGVPYQSIVAQSPERKDLRNAGARPASPVMLQSSRPRGTRPLGPAATASVNHSARSGESERITVMVRGLGSHLPQPLPPCEDQGCEDEW